CCACGSFIILLATFLHSSFTSPFADSHCFSSAGSGGCAACASAGVAHAIRIDTNNFFTALLLMSLESRTPGFLPWLREGLHFEEHACHMRWRPRRCDGNASDVGPPRFSPDPVA